MNTNLNSVMHVSEKLTFERNTYSLNVGEQISELIRLNSLINDKNPKFFRAQDKNKDYVTTYNSIGVMLTITHLFNETNGLESVRTHRQFVFGGDKERIMMNVLKFRIAYHCGFVTFANSLGKDATKFFAKILK